MNRRIAPTAVMAPTSRHVSRDSIAASSARRTDTDSRRSARVTLSLRCRIDFCGTGYRGILTCSRSYMRTTARGSGRAAPGP